MATTTTGVVHQVDVNKLGSQLVADAPAATNVLTLETAAPYSPTGGSVMLGDATAVYVSADAEAGTVTLAEPLAATLEAGFPVWQMAGQEIDVTSWATVDLDDPDAGPISAQVPTAIRGWLSPERDYTTPVPVTLEFRDGAWRVVGPNQATTFDATYTYAPTARAAKGTNDTIPHSAWTTLVGWFPLKSDRVTLDPSGMAWTVEVDGEYDIRVGATFAAGGAGNRAVRMHYYGADGADMGVSRMVKYPSDGATAVETAQYHYMRGGESVRFEVWQNSGADLDVRGSNVFTSPPLTDCVVKWTGPL